MTRTTVWRVDGREVDGRLRFRLWVRREFAAMVGPSRGAKMAMLSEKGVPTPVEYFTDRFGVRP
jgi:hypothetical protein